VIAPANTGSEIKRRIAVIFTAHTKRGICSNFIPIGFIFKIVEIKFIAPKIEEIPAR